MGGIYSFGIFIFSFSWIRWHQCRSENIHLKQNKAKYEVDKAIIQELNPQLSITLSGYEKLTDEYGKEATLIFFNDEITKLRSMER